MSTVLSSRITTCEPRLLWHREEGRRDRGSSTSGRYPMTVPSGSAVTADFRCSTKVRGTPMTSRREGRARRPVVPRRRGWCGPRPDPDLMAMLEHVAAVEGARVHDSFDAVAQLAQGLFGPENFGFALIGPRTRETARSPNITTVSSTNALSGQSSGWRNLDRLPASRSQRIDVRLPLPQREGRVNGRTRDVGDQSVRQVGTGPWDERTGKGHGQSLHPAGSIRLGAGEIVNGDLVAPADTQAFSTSVRVNPNVSTPSTWRSARTGTSRVMDVWPAGIVTVVGGGVKSRRSAVAVEVTSVTRTGRCRSSAPIGSSPRRLPCHARAQRRSLCRSRWLAASSCPESGPRRWRPPR